MNTNSSNEKCEKCVRWSQASKVWNGYVAKSILQTVHAFPVKVMFTTLDIYKIVPCSPWASPWRHRPGPFVITFLRVLGRSG